MVKRIIVLVALIMVLFVVSYKVHLNLLVQNLSFSLLHVYMFHALSVILVYVSVEVVLNKLPNQAGYAYLMMMFLKLGAFVLIFQTEVFAKDSLLQTERVSLVVPLFLFLIIEAIAVGKLLNNQ